MTEHSDLTQLMDQQAVENSGVSAYCAVYWDGGDPWGSNTRELNNICVAYNFLWPQNNWEYSTGRDLSEEEISTDYPLATELIAALENQEFHQIDILQYHAAGLRIDEMCRSLDLHY